MTQTTHNVRARPRSISTATTAAIAALVVLTACGEATETTDGESESQYVVNLDELKSRGADDVQIAALTDGTVTFEEYETAFSRYSSCVASAGGAIEGAKLAVQEGVRQFHYTIVSPMTADGLGVDEAADQLVQDCNGRHYEGIDIWWQTDNPHAIAYRERRAAALQKPMFDCLTEAGLRMPATSTLDELVSAAINTGSGRDTAIDCMVAIGYETWAG